MVARDGPGRNNAAQKILVSAEMVPDAAHELHRLYQLGLTMEGAYKASRSKVRRRRDKDFVLLRSNESFSSSQSHRLDYLLLQQHERLIQRDLLPRRHKCPGIGSSYDE